jgi:catalase (peroxidase I)
LCKWFFVLFFCRDFSGSQQRGDKRYSSDRDLENPLAAVQMGLI